MLTLQTDSITYGADMGGEFIAVHTNRAKYILPLIEQGKRYTVEIKLNGLVVIFIPTFRLRLNRLL